MIKLSQVNINNFGLVLSKNRLFSQTVTAAMISLFTGCQITPQKYQFSFKST